MARGQLQRAHDLAVRISAQAESMKGRFSVLSRTEPSAQTLFFLGRFAEALDETDQAIAIDDALEGSDNDRTRLFLYGERPGLISRLYAGWALWFLGFPIVLWHASTRRLRSLKNLVTHTPWHLRSRLRPVCGIIAATSRRRSQYAEAASRIAAKHDLPLWLGESAMAKGYAEASLGDHAEGIERLRSGISGLHRIGDWHHRSHWLGLLAAAYLEAGANRDAEAALDEALEAVAATQERYYAPELERLRGELLTRQGQFDQAAACFQKALGAAADMGAKSLELRAAMSLARLWSELDRRTAAYELLTPTYSWFTEDRDP